MHNFRVVFPFALVLSAQTVRTRPVAMLQFGRTNSTTQPDLALGNAWKNKSKTIKYHQIPSNTHGLKQMKTRGKTKPKQDARTCEDCK